MVAAKGLESSAKPFGEYTESMQNRASPTQNNALDPVTDHGQKQNTTNSIHSGSTSEPPKCVPGVYQSDLEKVVAVWNRLSTAARQRIVEIVEDNQ